MESISKRNEVFSKRGPMSTIFIYYGTFPECKRLALNLCPTTRINFLERESEYREALLNNRHEIWLDKFGTKEVDWLIQNQKYSSLSLSIALKDDQDFKRLVGFLQQVEEVEKVKIVYVFQENYEFNFWDYEEECIYLTNLVSKYSTLNEIGFLGCDYNKYEDKDKYPWDTIFNIILDSLNKEICSKDFKVLDFSMNIDNKNLDLLATSTLRIEKLWLNWKINNEIKDDIQFSKSISESLKEIEINLYLDNGDNNNKNKVNLINFWSKICKVKVNSEDEQSLLKIILLTNTNVDINKTRRFPFTIARNYCYSIRFVNCVVYYKHNSKLYKLICQGFHTNYSKFNITEEGYIQINDKYIQQIRSNTIEEIHDLTNLQWIMDQDCNDDLWYVLNKDLEVDFDEVDLSRFKYFKKFHIRRLLYFPYKFEWTESWQEEVQDIKEFMSPFGYGKRFITIHYNSDISKFKSIYTSLKTSFSDFTVTLDGTYFLKDGLSRFEAIKEIFFEDNIPHHIELEYESETGTYRVTLDKGNMEKAERIFNEIKVKNEEELLTIVEKEFRHISFTSKFKDD